MSLKDTEAERLRQMKDLLRKLDTELASAREEDRVIAKTIVEGARRQIMRAETARAACQAAKTRADDRAVSTLRRIHRSRH